MTGLEIAALIALLAGTGMQYKANTDAARRRAEETQRALGRQDQLERQAEGKALENAKEFATDNRAAQQDQMAADLTEQFIKPVESAQQINATQSTTQGNVSNDYAAAKAKSSLETLKSAEALARLLGKTTAAGRLRQNEAVRMANTAAGIDRLGSFSRGNAAADELAIRNAGTPNAEMMLGGQVLTGLGTMGLASGAGSAGSVAAGGSGVTGTASQSYSTAAPIGTATAGTGMTATGATRLRIPARFRW